MNPLLKKEIRLLLPAFLIACGLGMINLLPLQTRFVGLQVIASFLFCPVVAIMMALNSFGEEVGAGAFTALLAQPVSRQKIWQTKTVLLAIALVVVGLIWLVSIYFQFKILHPPLNPGDADFFGWMMLFVLVVYSGGLWTVLLLRQAAAAFWFTLLVPGAILVLISAFFNGENDDSIEGILKVALGLYSLAGFFFGRWLFMRAQDVQWSGGNIVLPELRGTPAWFSRLTAWRAVHPRAALWRKEFQLQQSQFIMAFVLLVLHPGVLAARKFGHFHKNSATEFILESFWLLWLVIPFLVGCAAVAEERKLGTHESHLCLPVNRRTQFAIKLGVVILLSIFFGVVFPVLFEGGRILPDTGHSFVGYLFGLYGEPTGFLMEWFRLVALYSLPFVLMTEYAIGIGLVSFFVSTLSRNTLQALAPAVVYVVFFVFWIMRAQIAGTYSPLWHGDLIYLIRVPIVVLTLLALAYWNFQKVRIGGIRWLVNLFIVSASLVLAAPLTTFLYYRPWEKLTPFEPPHGSARLAMSDLISLSQQRDGAFIRLPDGKVWTSSWSWMDPTPASLLFNNSRIQPQPGDFLPGSGWKMAGRMFGELVGIKEDGTLWISEKPSPIGKKTDRSYQENENAMRHLVQVGTETNWSELQTMYYSVLLTKTDGTLWHWGPPKFNPDREQWPGLIAFTPEQEGTGSNWAGFVHSTYTGFLRKKDGTFWTEDNLLIPKAPPLRNPTMAGLLGLWQIGINENGILCMWAEQHSVNRSLRRGYSEWIGTGWPIGSGSNWVAVASSDWNVVTLKDDGTLWFWDFSHIFNQVRTDENMENTVPVRLGIHSDWVALASGNGYIISLAADGSLWYWPMEDRWPGSYYYGDDDHRFEPLLDISRKPQLLGNVFSTNSITP